MTEPDLVARLDELAAEGNGRYTDILWDSWPQISRRLKAAEAALFAGPDGPAIWPFPSPTGRRAELPASPTTMLENAYTFVSRGHTKVKWKNMLL